MAEAEDAVFGVLVVELLEEDFEVFVAADGGDSVAIDCDDEVGVGFKRATAVEDDVAGEGEIDRICGMEA